MTLSAFNTRTQLLILPPLFPFFCACSVTVKEKMSYFRNGQRMEAQHGFNLLVTTIQSPSLLLCSLEGSLKDCSLQEQSQVPQCSQSCRSPWL